MKNVTKMQTFKIFANTNITRMFLILPILLPSQFFYFLQRLELSVLIPDFPILTRGEINFPDSNNCPLFVLKVELLLRNHSEFVKIGPVV